MILSFLGLSVPNYDIDESDHVGRTALTWASRFAHKEVVPMLLDSGADVNAQRGGYDNALQAASLSGHEKVVRILLDAGADVNTPVGKYGNALQVASYRDHGKIVQMLLDPRADVNAPGRWYVHGSVLQSLRGFPTPANAILVYA